MTLSVLLNYFIIFVYPQIAQSYEKKKKHFTDCFLSHVNYAFTFVIECFLRTFKIHFKNLIWVCSFVNLFSLTKSCSSVCLNGMKIKVSIYGY